MAADTLGTCGLVKPGVQGPLTVLLGETRVPSGSVHRQLKPRSVLARWSAANVGMSVGGLWWRLGNHLGYAGVMP